MTDPRGLSHRLAIMDDLPELRALMALSIRALIGAYLDAAGVEADRTDLLLGEVAALAAEPNALLHLLERRRVNRAIDGKECAP